MSRPVLATAAILEALTGIALVLAPQFVTQLLLGGDLVGPGTGVGRVGGFGLIALGIACWPRQGAAGSESALAAMLTYNSLATLYLGYLAAGGQMSGPLLWPAALLHAVLTILLVRAWLGRRHMTGTNVG